MSTNTGMKDLIAVINRLHEAFTTTGQNLGLELPQIAVVGGQSAGKSSVLENFVGKDFLPRGAGIVTRRPLVLQLHHSDSNEEWAEFLHAGNQRYTNFDEVREEIEAETDRLTGSNKGIDKTPIHLRVYSPHVLDLTLIDLPGLTKVPVGDQPEDIEHQIRDMINDYIYQENTLILAVTPANQDLANSDALKLAREADPTGLRTIGVITKLDLMDEGTDAREIFEGKLLPLKKGYVGVVNRSQRDIDEKKGIVDALEKERNFFRESPYKSMIERMGTRYLQETLNDQLGKHIKEKLPSIKSSLQKNIMEADGKLKDLGYFDESERNILKLMFRLMSNFVDDVHSAIEGNNLRATNINVKGGALIHITMYREVYNLIQTAAKEPSENQVSVWLANIHGYRSSMFCHQLVLDLAVKELVETYKSPIAQGVSLIKNILLQCVQECCIALLDSFPKLKEEVLYLMDSEIMKNEERTLQFLFNYLNAQKAYVNDKHPDFKSGRYKAEPMFSNINGVEVEESSTDPEPISIPENQELMRGMVSILTPGLKADRDMIGSLFSSKLVIYKDDVHYQRSKELHTIPLSSFQYESVPNPKGYLIVLQTKDGRAFYKNERKLELLVPNDKVASWLDALKNIAAFNDIRGSVTNLKPKSRVGLRSLFGLKPKQNIEVEIKADPVNQEQTSVICQMVRKYMKIVDVSVYDVVPKYIILGLVQETLRYAKEDLLGDLLKARASDEEKAELMETGNDDKRKINELLATKEATIQALKILDSI